MIFPNANAKDHHFACGSPSTFAFANTTKMEGVSSPDEIAHFL